MIKERPPKHWFLRDGDQATWPDGGGALSHLRESPPFPVGS